VRGKGPVALIILLVVVVATALYVLPQDGELDLGLTSFDFHEQNSLSGYAGGEKSGSD